MNICPATQFVVRQIRRQSSVCTCAGVRLLILFRLNRNVSFIIIHMMIRWTFFYSRSSLFFLSFNYTNAHHPSAFSQLSLLRSSDNTVDASIFSTVCPLEKHQKERTILYLSLFYIFSSVRFEYIYKETHTHHFSLNIDAFSYQLRQANFQYEIIHHHRHCSSWLFCHQRR